LAFPPDAVLGRTPDGGWHDPVHRPDAVAQPGLLVYRFSAPLFFANCNVFRDRIEALVAGASPPVRAVVVDGGAIHDVDLMACELLVELERDLAQQGVRLVFGNLRDRVQRDIERGLPPLIEGEEVTFLSVAAAASAVAAQ
jgi:MFS superfamily sulfate permease-like transporter